MDDTRVTAALVELAGLIKVRNRGTLVLTRSSDGRLRPAEPTDQPSDRWTDPARARPLYDRLCQCTEDDLVAALRAAVEVVPPRAALLVAITVGRPACLGVMRNLLWAYGDRRIVTDYLNSESTGLAGEAKAWASRNGYRVTQWPGGSAATWGTF